MLGMSYGYGKHIVWRGDEQVHYQLTVGGTVYHLNLATFGTFLKNERKHLYVSARADFKYIIDRNATTAMGVGEIFGVVESESTPFYLGTIPGQPTVDLDFYLHFKTVGSHNIRILFLQEKNLIQPENIATQQRLVSVI